MALAGLKKQFNKANQYMSEKIGGAEGTKFTDEFTHLERKTDLTNELVEELLNKTKEYLQPNPASRTKLMVSSKLKGTPGRPHAYPQPEGLLGEIMCKYGKEFGEESNFARSLIEMGEAMKELSEVKYALEDNVKQNFLEPLTHLQAKDLKDVLFHRKKLEGRRLDFDCKKRKKTKGTHVTDDEIKLAEDKFEESFNLAGMGMHNLLQNEIEQLSQICVLAEALYEYHSQCANIIESLNARLMDCKNEAAQRSFQPYVPKKLHELNLLTPSIGNLDDLSPGESNMNGSKPTFTSHTNNHYSSTQSLSTLRTNNTSNQTSNHKPVYPNLSSKSSFSSSSRPSKAPSKTTNGHLNGVTNSTTAYLLSGKPSLAQKPQFQSHFSKSIPNVSNLNFDQTDGLNNADLLGSIENEANSWESSTSHSRYQASSHNSSSLNNRTSNYYDYYSSSRTPTERGPSAQALYDFDPENENELGFKEGDLIQLVSQVDDNWYEGLVNGRTGLFPVSYVQVVVPLQQNSR